jgi:hypothetical protein
VSPNLIVNPLLLFARDRSSANSHLAFGLVYQRAISFLKAIALEYIVPLVAIYIDILLRLTHRKPLAHISNYRLNCRQGVAGSIEKKEVSITDNNHVPDRHLSLARLIGEEAVRISGLVGFAFNPASSGSNSSCFSRCGGRERPGRHFVDHAISLFRTGAVDVESTSVNACMFTRGESVVPAALVFVSFHGNLLANASIRLRGHSIFFGVRMILDEPGGSKCGNEVKQEGKAS